MKKVVIPILMIISLFLFSTEVSAKAQRDQIDYQITSIDINNQKVTLKGWAIIGGHNNYGGVLTNIKLVAKSPNRSTTVDGYVELNNSSRTYGDNANNSTYGYCWQRECTEAKDENGNTNIDPETGNTWLTDKYTPARWTYKGDCFYRNMYFTATFDTSDLQYLGEGVYFLLTVEYNKQHDNVDKCSVSLGDRGNAANIINAIESGKYNWGYTDSKDKTVYVEKNKCKVNGNACQNNQDMQINGKNVELRITNYGTTFRLNFDGDYEQTPLSARNVHKKLICEENEMFQSVTEEEVRVRVTAYYSDGKCSNSASEYITAEYYAVQSGTLGFHLDQGPIYSGGNFTFGIDYKNVVRWYYGNRIDTCPLITIPNSKWGSYSCNCHRVCSGSGENRSCHTSCDTCYGCVDSATAYPDNCKTLDDAKKLYEETIPKNIYDGVDEDTDVELPKDSNSVKNSERKSKVGTWECEPVVNGDGIRVSTSSRWKPGEEWITNCHYTLPKAMLNVQTADVEYNRNYTGDVWMDQGNSYFTPLKWPTGTFPVASTLNGLSSINTVDWSAEYSCEVETKQMLYDLDNGGFLFFYRPISIANPFPDRDPSMNWIDWWSNEDNRETLMNSYNNLEYKIKLSPTDMRDIRDYNNSMLKNGSRLGYLDYSINANGTSNFFSQNFIGNNFSRYTSDYSRLGEMSE